MNDELRALWVQRSTVLFQPQPEGLGLFFHPATLVLACVEPLHRARTALLSKKIDPAGHPF